MCILARVRTGVYAPRLRRQGRVTHQRVAALRRCSVRRGGRGHHRPGARGPPQPSPPPSTAQLARACFKPCSYSSSARTLTVSPVHTVHFLKESLSSRSAVSPGTGFPGCRRGAAASRQGADGVRALLSPLTMRHSQLTASHPCYEYLRCAAYLARNQYKSIPGTGYVLSIWLNFD